MIYNRAFIVRPIKGRFGKLKGYTISDGMNDITLGVFDCFTIDTNKPMDKPIIKH